MSKPENCPTVATHSVIGASPSTALAVALSAVVGLMNLGPTAEGRDILRPNMGGNNGAPAPSAGARPHGPSVAAQLRATGNDRLSRTTEAVHAVRQMQNAARNAARSANHAGTYKGMRLPNVPNGLGKGGLQVAPGVPLDLKSPKPGENSSLWVGAKLPRQTVSGGKTKVTIKQTKQQALLHWETFNVGKDTTVHFNQTAGGNNASKWIAFNKIQDPSGVPSQILGSIKAEGQVYLINQNGIIFGGASQINVRSLVASALPINDNLIARGLLNNPDAQFLFSSLPLAGGADGTPGFYPTTSDAFTLAEGGSYTFIEPLAVSSDNTPLRTPTLRFKAGDGTRTLLTAGTDYNVTVDATTKKATVTFTEAGLEKVGGAQISAIYAPKAAKAGDVIVRRGAVISSPTNADGNGGRVMLVGANVNNAGTISTPSGQTVLAAGLQVGIAPHASSDPSLRGLDVWVGAVEGQSGVATNSGLIESFTGSTLITGKKVNQLGAIDSTTSVSLNGRIDLRASYGAVSNPTYDDAGTGGGPAFFYQHTGSVALGAGSVTRILPDYLSESTAPGTRLPENSQINVEGQAINSRRDAMMLAPSGDISLRAGTWPYKDANGDGTVLGNDGKPEPGLVNFRSGASQRFFFSGGQIYMDRSSFIDVSGSTDVYVPLAHSILEVEFRGSELADSPLQRNGLLRATALTVDLRRTGESYGRFWMGTPLGDATGLAGLIQRNAAQLTARGGNVSMRAGSSIVLQEGSTIDVSGGYYRHEGGMVQTSRLLHNGNLIDIADAQPGLVYDGVYTGRFTESSAKWGVSRTFSIPFMAGARYEPGYLQGADGGTLALVAPSMALDGKLLGRTLQDPRGRSLPPAHGSLSIAFNAEKMFAVSATDTRFLPTSPTPPAIRFGNDGNQTAVPALQLAGDGPVLLPADRIANVVLSPGLLEEDGFGHLTIENTDGDITLPANVRLSAAAKGSITLKGANVSIFGDISAPGGTLNFTAHTISPAFAAEFPLLNPSGALAPSADPGRGMFTLGASATLSAAGLVVDDRIGAPDRLSLPMVTDGGTISVKSYNARLLPQSTVDVSGGVAVSASGGVSYGKGGSITIDTGSDPGLSTVNGGQLELGGALMGYSGGVGGSLSLRTSLIQVGGASTTPGVLLLQPDFFRTGGFSRYSLTGIGALAGGETQEGELDRYIPAIHITAGTRIEPVAESLLATPHSGTENRLGITRILLPAGQRTPVSLSFSAAGADDPFTIELLEARGDIQMGKGAEIVTDPGASVSFSGDTVSLLGSVQAPGGVITVKGASEFPLVGTQATNAGFARATVYIGDGAELSTKGTEVLQPDAFGRRIGTLFSGGTISVSGNIVAESGAILDVSGASTTLDLHPSMLTAADGSLIPASSGVTSPIWSLQSVPTKLDSSGGLIDLQGSEMLFSDATLLGGAGGPTAAGGRLSVFSGRFYTETESRTSADINLIVTQSGLVLAPNQERGAGLPVLDGNGTAIKGLGYFAVDRFTAGEFHSLDLGATFLQNANPFPFGGNVEFRGAVTIDAPGALRVAGGGVIQASSQVVLKGSYVSIGQPFRAPLHPDDPVILFQQNTGAAQSAYHLAPRFGTGSLVIDATVIDTGHVSMQGIGSATLIADGGDIRGNGTLSIAGDLTMRAGQIYPTTAGEFTIVAHDKNLIVASASSGSTQVTLASPVLPPGFGVGSTLLGSKVASINEGIVTLESGANASVVAGTAVPFAEGSITIIGSGSPNAPLSGGGRIGIFASKITQGGTVRAPLGSITIGWDGTDFNPADSDMDRPLDAIAGTALSVPVARNVVIKAGSLTSVSAVQPSGEGMVIPYGLSPDGLTWIDPRGVNVTIGGLPSKSVAVAGDRVRTQAGSVIEIGGGGDLYAFRWVPGIGGSTDILGTTSKTWTAGSEYKPGDLVTFGGRTWSARVRHTGESPTVSLYWSLVPESFAVLPSYTAQVAPFTPFNTGANSASLGGAEGYVSNSLKVGDRVFLDGGTGLSAGVYTLLPSRYALLPGAFLVTPGGASPVGTINLPDGTSLTSGYRFNEVNRPEQLAGVRNRFEVLSSDVLRSRAQYDEYSANTFMVEAAQRFNLKTPQRLPIDSGHLSFHGNTALDTRGAVATARPDGGRGATIDLSSFGDIHVLGGRSSAPAGATTVLNTSVLRSWGAESLLIGGTRYSQGGNTFIDVRTNNLVLDNRGSDFGSGEITLASRGALTLAAGSSVTSTGSMTSAADTFHIRGDGALLRVSGDASAGIIRTGTTASQNPMLTIGDRVVLGGAGVILDSTYGTSLAATTDLRAGTITLGSGQISVVLDGANGPAGGVADPQLTLEGQFLADVRRAESLTLRSYGTIDFHGDGNFSLGDDARLVLSAGGIRGFEQGAGGVTISAGNVVLTNTSEVANPTAPVTSSGVFTVDAGTISLGDNAFSVVGYDTVRLNAAMGVVGQSKGSFNTPGNITITTPVITGVRGATHSITAGGELVMERGEGTAMVQGGLGASFTLTGSEVVANTNILLPSGELTVRATEGNVEVGGNLDASGTRKEFYDLIRFTNAGTITLTSEHGDVQLLADSRVSVSGAEGGGNAGTLRINAAEGIFESDGATLLGKAADGMSTGRFILDAGSLASLSDVSRVLNTGGFFQQRSVRVRTGDVLIENVDGAAHVARDFTISADTGSITVTGKVDASGNTGGNIALIAGGSVTLADGSELTVHAKRFSAAGKGGDVRLEAGAAFNGVANLGAVLDVQSGSTIDLGVDAFVDGSYMTPGSSAFYGQFGGKLHLRAPRVGNDIAINSIAGNIVGASAVIAEGYRVYDRTGNGTLDNTLKNQIHNDSTAYINAGYDAMRAKLLAGNPDVAALDAALVLAPGVEIINRTGDLTLGTTANNAANDWDLSTFRYGPPSGPKAAGVLTLRAAGNLVFQNALSDGFNGAPGGTPAGQQLWLSSLMTIKDDLPVNAQSWSFRLAAGADLSSANFQGVQSAASLAPDSGSLFLGKFYDAQLVSGANATTATAINNRYQVIRTGTGDIQIATAGDVQLRNQFASIYTAGVALPDPTTIFADGDFVVPVVTPSAFNHPSQGNLGAIQQIYPAQWSMAGGNVSVSAGGNIGRYTRYQGEIIIDSSRQLPNNWLYRRGFVDAATGLFAAGGVVSPPFRNITDPSASTTWWVDFSNFFQGFGALGGGDISLTAANDIVNADALIPTNARMPGRDPVSGFNVAPDASKLVELGGGDLSVQAGRNIDGGVYYVERGQGTLVAGGEIKTNASRSPSLGILGSTDAPPSTVESVNPAIFDSRTWLPTTLFVGKSSFDVSARGDVLLGPVTNPFLLPQGLNNKFWYKTVFNTFSPDAGVDVASIGGSVTHRMEITPPGGGSSQSILSAWLGRQNLFAGSAFARNASNFQPWIRLSELDIASYSTVLTVVAPTLRSTAFGGDVNLVGDMNLFPSATGTLELAASGSVVGLNSTGRSRVQGRDVDVWTAASVNVSDANPALIPGVETPLAYASFVGLQLGDVQQSRVNFYANVNRLFQETGSFTGTASTPEVQQSLHAPGLLHQGDLEPVRIYAAGGEISGLQLFSPKAARVIADGDITDVSLYIQNLSEGDLSLVSSGRDIVPFNENAPIRTRANDLLLGNIIGDVLRSTVAGNQTSALAGDIQISGPGVVEVLAGRNLDLGTGANFPDGTGSGITSIGNARNPYLPQEGADLIAFAGVTGSDGGAASNLSASSLDFAAFIEQYLAAVDLSASPYATKLGGARDLESLTPEQQSIVALEVFFDTLKTSGRAAATTKDYSAGVLATETLFGTEKTAGDIFTRSRDLRTSAGGAITIGVPGGGLTLASDIFGNPLTPPGVVTEFGGAISVFTDGTVDIGQARLFTLRGGDIIMWSATGNIGAGTAAKTVVTAPPTRVLFDTASAAIQTDLGGLATGGGIGVLASVEGVEAGDVDLIAPQGEVDAGDAGIRVTGNLNIAAVAVLNAANIQVGGTAGGVPSAAPVAAPNIGALSAASSTSGATAAAASQMAQPKKDDEEEKDEKPSLIVVEVIGYGGGEG